METLAQVAQTVEADAKHAFNAAADEMSALAKSIYDQRGGEYQDTWALGNQVTTFLDNVLRELKINLTAEEKRLLVMASMVDVKDSRMLGAFKLDTVLDGINYRAVFAKWMDDYTKAKAALEAAAKSL